MCVSAVYASGVCVYPQQYSHEPFLILSLHATMQVLLIVLFQFCFLLRSNATYSAFHFIGPVHPESKWSIYQWCSLHQQDSQLWVGSKVTSLTPTLALLRSHAVVNTDIRLRCTAHVHKESKKSVYSAMYVYEAAVHVQTLFYNVAL